jgi:hypothetical protein
LDTLLAHTPEDADAIRLQTDIRRQRMGLDDLRIRPPTRRDH